MKFNKLSIILVAVIAISSCSKLEKLTQFTLKFNQDVTIPSTFGINIPFDISTPEINTNSNTIFEGNNTNSELIKTIKLSKLQLEMVDPTDADFSFMSAIEIFISAEGMAEKKIAWKTSIPNDATLISLDLDNVDLQDYIKADKFKLRLNTTTDELMSENHTLKVSTEFFVDANVLGQ
jgi:hypothetical protein